MPAGIQQLSAERILESGGDVEARLVDLRTQWIDWTGRRVFLDCGGVWDRKDEGYVDDGESAQIIKFQPAQYAAVEWFSGWLKAYIRGGPRPPEYDRKWTMFNFGGRRGGKTHFAVNAADAFASAVPGSIVWLISPTQPETLELQAVIEKVLPGGWFHFSDSKLIYTLANHSKIELKSGFKPSNLRRGEVDLWVMNEAQNMSKRAYTHLRAPLADTGGLGIVVANPPDKPIGRWILEAYDECRAGRRAAVMFEFDPLLNPTIDHRALADMRNDVGDKDYQRDVLGEMIEIGDLVWYAFSPRENVQPVPDVGDITKEITRKMLGREFDNVLGIDLQLSPHMAAAGAHFFNNPDDADDPLAWFDDEIIIEGDEDDLIDALETKGYSSANTALVIDASGWWQDAERTKGRGSVDMFRRRGWKFCFRPDRKAKRNPHIYERCLATNARLKSASGKRRMFVDPHCLRLIETLKRWENKNGLPHRRSVFAHTSDAISYLIYRFFERRVKSKGLEYKRIERKRSQRERDFDAL